MTGIVKNPTNPLVNPPDIKFSAIDNLGNVELDIIVDLVVVIFLCAMAVLKTFSDARYNELPIDVLRAEGNVPLHSWE